jgi:hypothetical protein
LSQSISKRVMCMQWIIFSFNDNVDSTLFMHIAPCLSSKPYPSIPGCFLFSSLDMYVLIWRIWQDLHDDDKTCMQLSYWELILKNGQ